MPLQARDYQLNAIASARIALAKTKTTSLVAPCGSGKTILAAEISWLSLSRNNKTLIICPYQSLLDQFAGTMLQKGFKGTKKMYETFLNSHDDSEVQAVYERLCKSKNGFNNSEVAFYAGSKNDSGLESASVVIAMAQTIESRGIPDIQFSVIFFDESHLTYFRHELHRKLSMYRYYSKAKEILMTATPWRGDGADYPEGVEHIQVISTYEQILNGYNSPYRYFPLGTMERKDAVRFRDFSEKEELELLEKIANPEKAWESLYTREIFDQQTIFFFSRKAIALKYMAYFRTEMDALGLDRELILVCDATSPSERAIAFKKFRERKALLVTVTCLAIGFDEPSIENIVLLRTFSKGGFALFIQILGRGLRISPATGKTECRMFDLCSNPYFPLPDEILDWNSSTIPEKPEGRECRECGTVCGRAMKFCYKCGAEIPAAIKSAEEELSDLDKQLQAYLADTNIESITQVEQMHANLKEYLGVTDTRKFVERLSIAGQSPESTYRIFLKLAVLLYKFKPGWAWFQTTRIFPSIKVEFKWKQHAIFGDQPTFGNYLYFHQYLRNCYGSGDQKSNQKVYGSLRDEFGIFNIKFNEQYQELVRVECARLKVAELEEAC